MTYEEIQQTEIRIAQLKRQIGVGYLHRDMAHVSKCQIERGELLKRLEDEFETPRG